MRRRSESFFGFLFRRPGRKASSSSPLLLQRFMRGSHVAQTPGSGLGLHLVATIVRFHGFMLDLADNEPGLKVRIVA